jgi:hypothetical protein
MGEVKIERVVIDTNVVVSALLFGGAPGELIPLWKGGRIKTFASREIIDEYLRVFTYPRFDLSENEIEYLIYKEILPYFEVVPDADTVRIVEEDASDDKFISCALGCNAGAIISGDRHLLELGRHKDIEIITPSRFLQRRNG